RNGARSESVAALRAQWNSAASAARLAALTSQRVEKLYEAQVDTLQERDTALAAARSTAEQERSAHELYLEAAGGNRPEDIAAAGGAVQAALGQVQAAGGALQQAYAAIDFTGAQQAETRIAAPSAGEVTTIVTHAGEIAPVGYPVVTLLDVQHPYATFNVPENLLARFAVGAVVAANVPALGGATLRFKVYYESPLGEFATEKSTRISSGEDLRTFEVRARPLERVSDLRAGMSVVVPR
ncbi:MAG: efflux RND transporter periplasmic adaptor subunit, partial [Candidatus Baltobacteraceae bacterium]